MALFNRAELLVAPRGDDGEQELQTLLHRPENEHFAHYVHPLPFDAKYRHMSSTLIRQGNAASLYDVPVEVQQFIHETHAYEPPQHQSDGTLIDAYAEHVKEMNHLLGM